MNMVVANGIVCHVLWALSVKARAIDFDNGLDLNTYVNINHIYICIVHLYIYIIYLYLPVYINIYLYIYTLFFRCQK